MASRAAALLVAAIFLCYDVGVCWCACGNVTEVSGRLDALLAEYERAAPPADKVTVQLQLEVRHANVIESTTELRLLADLHMSWQDDRLHWNTTEWGCDYALADAERLWIPDVTLVNAAASSAGEQPLGARVTSAGAVSWTARLDVSIPVEMRLTEWPNDEQTGVFKFASRAHSIDEIEISIQESQFATQFESGAWEMTLLSGSLDEVGSAVEGEAARGAAWWSVTLRRRAPSQALAARVTLAAALLLLASAALLPPTNRAPLAAAAATILAIWLCGVVWRLPGGAAPPRAVCLLGAACALAGALAAAAGLVGRVARLASAPPQLVRTAVSTASRVFVLSTPHEAAVGESGTWVAAASVLDALLLALLGLTLLVLLFLYL